MNKWIWVVLSVLFFQANDITLRLFSSSTNFIAASAMQSVPLAVVCGIAILKTTGFKRLCIGKGALLLIMLYGSLQFLVGNMMYFTSMRQGGLSIASPTVQSQAVWAVILGMVILEEKISPVMWCGISTFAAGIAGLAYFKSIGLVMQNGWALGALAGLFGGLCWASASAVQKKLLNEGADLLHILFLGSVFGIALLIVFGFVSSGTGFGAEFTKTDTYKMLIVGVFSGSAMWCVSQALKRIPISKVIPVLSINIIFNTITGGIFFGEFISPGTFISMLIAFLGILLVNMPSKALKRDIVG